MAEVQARENESVDSLLRRFKRAVSNERILAEIKNHSFFVSPGERRRVKSRQARKRQKKAQRMRWVSPAAERR